MKTEHQNSDDLVMQLDDLRKIYFEPEHVRTAAGLLEIAEHLRSMKSGVLTSTSEVNRV